MGHHNHHKAYSDLRARFDRMATGFPDTPEARAILELLFSPEEAEVVARMPLVPRSARSIARRLGRDEAQVAAMLDHAAGRGLIFDLYNPRKDVTYYAPAPPVVGFLEFALMRRRKDLDQRAVAREMDAFFHAESTAEAPAFRDTVFHGPTQIGRTLVHEPALRVDQVAELLSYERAEHLLREARSIATTLCYCRHKAEHLGQACEAPMDNCMSLNVGADYAVRHQGGRALEVAEALDILEQSRVHGLVLIADNVQRRPVYICSCCGCCCAQLRAITDHGLEGAVKTSPMMAMIDQLKCTGCGRCARRCPVQAITLRARHHADPGPRNSRKKARLFSEIDESICLGCGVCVDACKEGALTMELRAERVLTPEGTLERVLSMALERDRLHHQIFDDLDGWHMAALNRLFGVVLRLPPVKRTLLAEKVKSRFIAGLVDGSRRLFGGVKDL